MSRIFPVLALAASYLTACGDDSSVAPSEQVPAEAVPVDEAPAAAESTAAAPGAWTELVPGLSMRVLETGTGDTAAAGQMATVHYTGWLHDPDAADGRGNKFDSSVDRGQYFEFPLGAGRVIRGWDQGVVGMSVGEKRELLIAPEMAYGDRQVGDLIPPGSTLLFEVELAGLDGNVPGDQ